MLWCVGTKPRASELFVDRSVLSLEPESPFVREEHGPGTAFTGTDLGYL